MRFRILDKEGYRMSSAILQPRSAYVLLGEARWRWQHSIPPVDDLRFSITFRSLGQKQLPPDLTGHEVR